MMSPEMKRPRKEAVVTRMSSHHLALICHPILVAAIQNHWVQMSMPRKLMNISGTVSKLICVTALE